MVADPRDEPADEWVAGHDPEHEDPEVWPRPDEGRVTGDRRTRRKVDALRQASMAELMFEVERRVRYAMAVVDDLELEERLCSCCGDEPVERADLGAACRKYLQRNGRLPSPRTLYLRRRRGDIADV